MTTSNATWTRRAALALALTAAATFAAQAQSTTAEPFRLRNVGVFALLGESIQVTSPGAVTDTRLNNSFRDNMLVKDLGLDQAALRAVRNTFAKLRPATTLSMYRSTAPMTPAEQRALSDGAARAELPAWIVSAIDKDKLSHVLLLTRHRGDASFPLANGHDIGRGVVEGIGYYLDTATEIKNLDTGLSTRGFLGSYVQMRLQLMDAQSGEMLASRDIRAGQMFGGRNDQEIANIWLTLDPREKADVLREMVQSNVERVLPAMLDAKPLGPRP